MTDLLCEAVRIHTDLNQQMEGGGTKREHLENIEKQTGRQQLPDYEIPFAGQHLWDWFWQLSNRRQSGFGASLVSYTEIRSWLEVRKPLIHDWEIEILIQMDQAFLQAHQELGKTEPKNKRSR